MSTVSQQKQGKTTKSLSLVDLPQAAVSSSLNLPTQEEQHEELKVRTPVFPSKGVERQGKSQRIGPQHQTQVQHGFEPTQAEKDSSVKGSNRKSQPMVYPSHSHFSGRTALSPSNGTMFSPVFNPSMNFMIFNQAVNNRNSNGKRFHSQPQQYVHGMKRPRHFEFIDPLRPPAPSAPPTSEMMTEETKRIEKNKREKQRRQELNAEIKRLALILDLPQQGSTEKVVILRKAADELARYKHLEKYPESIKNEGAATSPES